MIRAPAPHRAASRSIAQHRAASRSIAQWDGIHDAIYIYDRAKRIGDMRGGATMKFNPVTDEYEPEGPWDEPPRCLVCGDEMERELCEHCDGSGQVDCYEADAINYAPGQDDEPCGQCDGDGGWWLCPQRGDARHAVAHEAASVPAPHTGPYTRPWLITVRLNARWRDNWKINATVDATCEADALDQAQATLCELLGKDIPRDQISAVDAPF